MSILNTSEKPEIANIQGDEIHFVKKTGRKSECANLGRRLTGEEAALPTDTKKGHVENPRINNLDRQSDATTMEENMHEYMTTDKN